MMLSSRERERKAVDIMGLDFREHARWSTVERERGAGDIMGLDFREPA